MSASATELNMLAWNVEAGGFDSYTGTEVLPRRGDKIQAFLHDAKQEHGLSAVTLTDALRWDEVYGGDDGIAEHLGYKAARFMRLEDQRLIDTGGSGIGIAFATDEKIHTSKALDLETRLGLGVILDVGRYGLQVANVYLDNLREDVRMRQVDALISELEPDIPTLLVGDMNTLRPTMRHAKLRAQVGNALVRTVPEVIPPVRPGIKAVRDMNRNRRVVSELESHCFHDADAFAKRPTFPALLPVLGLDYVFYRGEITVVDPDILPVGGASDHRAIRYTTLVS